MRQLTLWEGTPGKCSHNGLTCTTQLCVLPRFREHSLLEQCTRGAKVHAYKTGYGVGSRRASLTRLMRKGLCTRKGRDGTLTFTLTKLGRETLALYYFRNTPCVFVDIHCVCAILRVS